MTPLHEIETSAVYWKR